MGRKRKGKRGRGGGEILEGKLFKINGKIVGLYRRGKLIEGFKLGGIGRGWLSLGNWENRGILGGGVVRVNNICY